VKPHPTERTALVQYMSHVEPIRLAVNRLLEGADPLLSAFRSGRISPRRAGTLMRGLERRFAVYTAAIGAIEPADSVLATMHRPYAFTCVLEDAYLSALAAALPTGRFANLPDTQASQRAAIIKWRTQLSGLARRLGVHLPADLHVAGRGEIAPAPTGS
jgi:hypothetical protein